MGEAEKLYEKLIRVLERTGNPHLVSSQLNNFATLKHRMASCTCTRRPTHVWWGPHAVIPHRRARHADMLTAQTSRV